MVVNFSVLKNEHILSINYLFIYFMHSVKNNQKASLQAVVFCDYLITKVALGF